VFNENTFALFWFVCLSVCLYVQSNLSTTATLGTAKKWLLYRGGRSVEGFQSKLVSKLAWPDFVRPLLTGGRYSEVAVNTGLTVCLFSSLEADIPPFVKHNFLF
jgi:hypothetical protein